MKMISTFALAALFAVVGCNQTPKELPSTSGESLSTITATVEALDQTSRIVTLRGPEGNAVTFRASDEVKNLSQVKVGDKVKVNYFESYVAQVRKPGEPAESHEHLDAARAGVGETPGAYSSKSVTVTTKVQGIDPKAPSITLRNPEGKVVTIPVRKPENVKKLKDIKVGDEVVITYTEGVAISVVSAE